MQSCPTSAGAVRNRTVVLAMMEWAAPSS